MRRGASLPFHYGRWVYQRNVWCWAPGRWVARPVYAPALVAWVGVPGASVSIGIGAAVGWFPLAPREVFVPGYRTTPRYVRNVNVTHVTNIGNVTNIIEQPERGGGEDELSQSRHTGRDDGGARQRGQRSAAGGAGAGSPDRPSPR